MDMSIDELITYLLTPAAQIALIIGLAEVVKRFGLDTRYIPLFDIVIGILSGVGIYGIAYNHGIINGLLVGLFLGLSACGLFSGIKNTIEK